MLLNNVVFWKNIELIRIHKDMKLPTTGKKYLVSEQNYHCSKMVFRKLLSTETRKTRAWMNKTIYLALLIIDISKMTLIEFWYDYVKTKYGQNAELWQKVFTLTLQNMLKRNLIPQSMKLFRLVNYSSIRYWLSTVYEAFFLKFTAKPYTSLVNDTTLASYNTSHFRRNLLKRIKKIFILLDKRIRDEKLRYNINKEVAKIFAL